MQNLPVKHFAEAQLPDWIAPAFIKRMSLDGSWESLRPDAEQLLLENDRMVVFCLKDRVADAQKKFKV